VVAPNYLKAKFRFQNTNFHVLLIMQFNKVLIISSPYTIVTYFKELSVIQKLLIFRAIPSSVKVTNTKQMWIVKTSSNILNSVLFLIQAQYFNMNTRERKLNGVSEIRFFSMIFLLRMAGIPFKMKKISTIYTIYMVTVIICTCSTCIGTFIDVYINWDDLGRAMTTMRVLISFANIMWIFSNCR
jgi:hypothetical protein